MVIENAARLVCGALFSQGCDGAESSCNSDVVESTLLLLLLRATRCQIRGRRGKKRRLSMWVCHVWEGRQIRFQIQIQIQIEGVGLCGFGGRKAQEWAWARQARRRVAGQRSRRRSNVRPEVRSGRDRIDNNNNYH